jgi:hypothetical protein
MIHPYTRLAHVSESVGDGVFATADIPAGTIAYVVDPLDIRLSRSDFERLDPAVREAADKYSYIDQTGCRILSWDLAKYVNHSCEPNTLSAGYGFEVALRDIARGEQITDDYGLFNLEWSIECHCGSASCRMKISGSDLDRHADRWDAQMQDALALVRHVEQPLWDVVDAETREALLRYLDGTDAYRSVRALRWSGLTSLAAGRRIRRA